MHISNRFDNSHVRHAHHINEYAFISLFSLKVFLFLYPLHSHIQLLTAIFIRHHFSPSILFKRNHSNFRRILCAILSIILITIVYQYTLGIGTTSVFGDLILIFIFSHFSFQHHRDCTWILIQCYDLSTHLVFSSLIIFFTLFCNFYSQSK